MPLPAAANDDAVIAGDDDARLRALAARVARDLGRGVDVASVRAAMEVLAQSDAEVAPVCDAAPVVTFKPGEPITILAADICAALGAEQLLELHHCEGGDAEFDQWGDVMVAPSDAFTGELTLAVKAIRAENAVCCTLSLRFDELSSFLIEKSQ